MKILHTADLHLGQIIYQNYDRSDEHRHFFRQLERWCIEEKPDALLVCGDVYDIQQPSSLVKKAFTDYFVRLRKVCPYMTIVITAGNHDSASRIQADNGIWELADAHLIGTPLPYDYSSAPDDWQNKYIIKLQSGYIVALPYMTGERQQAIQSILDKIAIDNTLGLPVVIMAHQAVTGVDVTGHDLEIGKLKTQDAGSFGRGFDYLALGHIHKPQTIGRQTDCMTESISYPSPVIRYSGSALHVSCDENYPHTVTIADIDYHGGNVHISQKRIVELRHFYVLPTDGSSFNSAEEALQALKLFICQRERGYIRFRFDQCADLPSDFSQQVYDILKPYNDEWRYNPKMIWTGHESTQHNEEEKSTFEVAELQQMTDPMLFIERTFNQYAGLDLDDVRKAFEEVRVEMIRLNEERQTKSIKKQKTPEP